jgi:hypothetical protein
MPSPFTAGDRVRQRTPAAGRVDGVITRTLVGKPHVFVRWGDNLDDEAFPIDELVPATSHRTAEACELHVGDTVEHLPSGRRGEVVAIGTTGVADIYQVRDITGPDSLNTYERRYLKLVERARDDDAPTGEHVDAAVIVAAIDRAREAIVGAIEKRDTIVNVAAVDAKFDRDLTAHVEHQRRDAAALASVTRTPDDLAARDALSAIRARISQVYVGSTRSEMRAAIDDIADLTAQARS